MRKSFCPSFTSQQNHSSIEFFFTGFTILKGHPGIHATVAAKVSNSCSRSMAFSGLPVARLKTWKLKHCR